MNNTKNLIKNGSAIERLYYLDWIRIGAIFSVFLYHCNRFFDYKDYPIQAVSGNIISTIHREFVQIWLMPVFFVISGAAVVFSMKPGRKLRKFIKDKFFRLLLPLVTIGMFIAAPPQVYLERITQMEFQGSFLQWLPEYFSGIYPKGNFSFTGMHCWYLLTLFIYTILFLPLFLPSGSQNKSLLSRMSDFFEKPWTLFFMFLPLAALALLAEVAGLGSLKIMGGWDPLSYPLFFVYGYILFSNRRILDVLKKYTWLWIFFASIFSVIYIYLVSGSGIEEISSVARHNVEMKSGIFNGSESHSLNILWAGVMVLRSFLAWMWICFFLGFGARFLNFRNKFMDYANEAILPFYILHQTVLLVLGYFVIRMNSSNGLEYLIITSVSFVIVMVIYEFAVRRINILRLLFGMKIMKVSNK